MACKIEVKQIDDNLDFGWIDLKLDEYMTANQVSSHLLCEKANIGFPILQSLRTHIAQRVDFDTLARICYALNCDLTDIIDYVPKNPKIPEY